MKRIVLAVALIATIGAAAQQTLTPGNHAVGKKWIKNSNYQLGWYAINDTGKIELGRVSTSIGVTNDNITVVTNINLKRMSSTWIDSTIARTKDLSPVYHSSHNGQRDMVLNFGTIVKGFYYDKMSNKNYVVNDTTTQPYFDSNLYPALIAWLPLREGLKLDIPIYDYKPGGKTGVLKAKIQEIKKGTVTSAQSGIRKVWIVTVSDEIVGLDNGFVRYYIDVADRRLWKQEINAGGRKMEMVLLEN